MKIKTFLFAILIGAMSVYVFTKEAIETPCTTIYPDTCATCKHHIDTTKDNAMMMYINGDFVFRNEVEVAYEKRIEKIKKY